MKMTGSDLTCNIRSTTSNGVSANMARPILLLTSCSKHARKVSNSSAAMIAIMPGETFARLYSITGSSFSTTSATSALRVADTVG